jgi:hypothetical protein
MEEYQVNRPVILLDVDGPLNPFAAKATRRPEGFETHRARPSGWDTGKPLRVWLNPSHGASLLALGCEIVWATAWQTEANVWIGPHIGLPQLESIGWGEFNYKEKGPLHWKTEKLVTWMNENRPNVPFIWVDDEVTGRDRDFIEENGAPGSRILIVSPRFGLGEGDFEEILEWRQDIEQGVN